MPNKESLLMWVHQQISLFTFFTFRSSAVQLTKLQFLTLLSYTIDKRIQGIDRKIKIAI